MNNVKALAAELSARLPELDWKLGQSGIDVSKIRLPKGLFRCGLNENSPAYVSEIRSDLDVLTAQKDYRSAQFIAEKIRNKINVLVTVCKLHNNDAQKNPSFHQQQFITRLATRQQRLAELQDTITTLESQQQAISHTLSNAASFDETALLNLKAELGEVERQLTLARETFLKATS